MIATGGSVVYSQKAMEHLKQSGVVVYLDVSYDALVGRLSNITTRGIVFKNKQDLRSVYEERLPLYEQYGDYRIECTNLDIESAVLQIVTCLKQK